MHGDEEVGAFLRGAGRAGPVRDHHQGANHAGGGAAAREVGARSVHGLRGVQGRPGGSDRRQ